MSNSSTRPAWSFSHSSASHASANFCPDCQSILALPDADLILRCPDCSYQTQFTGVGDQRYEKLSISTKYSSSSKRDPNATDNATDDVPVAAFTRAKVKEKCEKCGNPEMSFYTMQMRSVDEGQTVFFECPKCGYTFSTNT